MSILNFQQYYDQEGIETIEVPIPLLLDLGWGCQTADSLRKDYQETPYELHPDKDAIHFLANDALAAHNRLYVLLEEYLSTHEDAAADHKEIYGF